MSISKMSRQQSPKTSQATTASTTNMKRIVSNDDVILPAKKRVKRDVSASTPINPSQLVQQMFQDNGWDCKDVVASAQDNFIDPTKDMISCYTMEVSMAVRDNNLEKLQELKASGALMNCCNKFGDTLLNIACRRSHTRIVKFLLEEANVSLTVRDDCGRVSLHDALWTSQPNFVIVDMLLRRAPEMALLPDKRGHTPFDYARSNNWSQWIQFLSERNSYFPENNTL